MSVTRTMVCRYFIVYCQLSRMGSAMDMLRLPSQDSSLAGFAGLDPRARRVAICPPRSHADSPDAPSQPPVPGLLLLALAGGYAPPPRQCRELRGRLPATGLEFNVVGRADAPVTIVEFSDLQCPHCARNALNTFPEIKRNYIDTGKVRYVARDFPLDMHPFAMPAAVATRCAGEQGKFWEYRHALFERQNDLGTATVRRAGGGTRARRAPVRRVPEGSGAGGSGARGHCTGRIEPHHVDADVPGRPGRGRQARGREVLRRQALRGFRSPHRRRCSPPASDARRAGSRPVVRAQRHDSGCTWAWSRSVVPQDRSP